MNEAQNVQDINYKRLATHMRHACRPSFVMGNADPLKASASLERQIYFLDDKNKKVEGEARQKGDAPCMIIFCAFDQQMYLIELAKRYGLNNYINLVFRKNFSAQVLKANMKIVGNCEYGLVLYRDKLPKFRNNGKI